MARFLVVDDHADSADALALLLRSDGHDVAVFLSGTDAIDALSRTRFDAIVTDLEMPNADGCAVLAAAREQQPHACLIVVTAADERAQELREAGACFVAVKPADYGELARRIAECHALGGRGALGRCRFACTEITRSVTTSPR